MGRVLSTLTAKTGQTPDACAASIGGSERPMLFERDVLVPAWNEAEKNSVGLFSVAQWSQVTMDDELLAGQLNYGKREFNH
jgi:hypothetical protein